MIGYKSLGSNPVDIQYFDPLHFALSSFSFSFTLPLRLPCGRMVPTIVQVKGALSTAIFCAPFSGSPKSIGNPFPFDLFENKISIH